LGSGCSLPANSTNLTVVSFTTATSEGCKEVVPVVRVLPMATIYTIFNGIWPPTVLVYHGILRYNAYPIFTLRLI
jgi:hypothetical protein